MHRGLPSRHLTFIVSLGEPVHIAAMPDPRHPEVRSAAFVSGLDDAPATIVHDGNQHGVSLALTPLGARALLGVPARELAGRVVGLDDLLGSTAERLRDRLASAPTWAARFAVLDDVLCDAANRAHSPLPRPEVTEAWRRLVNAGGNVEVGSLASDLGWSRRHLGEHFLDEIGLSPKAAAKVVRFERSCHLIRQPAPRPLAQVAALAGYYDQAHLNRDWRQMAGCTPTVWRAEELPSVQAPEADPGAC